MTSTPRNKGGVVIVEGETLHQAGDALLTTEIKRGRSTRRLTMKNCHRSHRRKNSKDRRNVHVERSGANEIRVLMGNAHGGLKSATQIKEEITTMGEATQANLIAITEVGCPPDTHSRGL